MIKAVIFDLYETLITEFSGVKFTSRRCADELGVDYALFREIWEVHHREMNDGTLTYEQVVDKICSAAGVSPSTELRERCRSMRVSAKSECFTRCEEEVLTMLDALRAKGMPLALCSNCSADEVEGLGKSPLTGYFKLTVLSYKAGIVKPDPGIYRLCSAGLDVSPRECLYVGDGGSRELYGAAKAGMKPVRAMWFLKKYVKNIESMPFDTAEAPGDVLKYISDI